MIVHNEVFIYQLFNACFTDLGKSTVQAHCWAITVNSVVTGIVAKTGAEECTRQPLLSGTQVGDCFQADFCVEVLDKISV